MKAIFSHPFQCTVLFAILLFALTGCKTSEDELFPAHEYPPPAAPAVAETPDPPRVTRPKPVGNEIRRGDTLELFVEEDNTFNGKYQVRERGDIIVSSLGRIPVAGMSMVDAGARIKAELEATHLKKATVIVDRVSRAPVPQNAVAQSQAPGKPASASRMSIFMTGKVNRPGQHKIPLPSNRSLGVYEAILIAGGMSKFGDPMRVHVLRADADGRKKRIPVNIKLIEQGLKIDPPIGEGDIVVVPEKVFGF